MNILQLCGAARFNACIEDNQGCDVARNLMEQLYDLGLVQHQGDGSYRQSELMIELKDEIKSRTDGFDLKMAGNHASSSMIVEAVLDSSEGLRRSSSFFAKINS